MKSVIFRCSQPKVGMQGATCAADEILLEHIRQAGNGDRNLPLVIIDARPLLNAKANMLKGIGIQTQLLKPEAFKNKKKLAKLNFFLLFLSPNYWVWVRRVSSYG